jgi:hypothetical protein
MTRKGSVWLICALTVGLLPSAAFSAEDWGPWPRAGSLVAAGFKHDDGGFMTRSDTGGNLDDGVAIAGAPNQLMLRAEDSTWHLNAMGHATIFFGVGTGEYARVFPAAGFRKATEPILGACGDHW